MPAYEICYLDGEGVLTYKFLANCEMTAAPRSWRMR